MTEPKCPYCGEEMLHTDPRIHGNRNGIGFKWQCRYYCPACFSYAPMMELDCDSESEVIQAARNAALRAQQEQCGLTNEQLGRAIKNSYIEGYEDCKAGKPPLENRSNDPLNGWISVKDRLPVDERQVLTFVGYEDNLVGFITTSYYLCYDENPHWQWDAMLQDGQRTLFWMPLPEPPKEGM